MLGKSVTDLQSNVVVGNNAIIGELKYVTGYTGFSSITEEQSGNYLVFHCASNDADKITVEIVGGKNREVQLDSDGIMIARIRDNSQKIRVRAYKNGEVANTVTYNLSCLTLDEE